MTVLDQVVTWFRRGAGQRGSRPTRSSPARAQSPPARPDSLADDLRHYLHATLAGTPPAGRGRWVMSADWWSEVRKADPRGPAALFWMGAPLGAPETLLGLPIDVRDGAGAPRIVPPGTECCGALISTVTHRQPSWDTCAGCGQPVTITGKPYSART